MNSPADPGRPTLVMSAMDITPRQLKTIAAAGGELVRFTPHTRLDDPVLPDIEVWVGDGLTDPLIKSLTRLDWVQGTSQGVENLLTGELLRSRAAVTNVSGMHAGVVAEHTLSLILALARALPRLVRAQLRHEWLALGGDDIRVLDGGRMVVLGTGEIGRAIAERARAFGIEIVGVNRTGKASDGFDKVAPIDRLLEECREAGWLVVACPLTPATRGIVDASVLSALGPGSLVVNMGRGPIVDTAALRHALMHGVIAGAALDVFEIEPLPDTDPLWDMKNVLIAPHIGGIMPGYMDVAVDYFADNLKRYREGAPLRSVVDKKAGY